MTQLEVRIARGAVMRFSITSNSHINFTSGIKVACKKFVFYCAIIQKHAITLIAPWDFPHFTSKTHLGIARMKKSLSMIFCRQTHQHCNSLYDLYFLQLPQFLRCQREVSCCALCALNVLSLYHTSTKVFRSYFKIFQFFLNTEIFIQYIKISTSWFQMFLNLGIENYAEK